MTSQRPIAATKAQPKKVVSKPPRPSGIVGCMKGTLMYQGDDVGTENEWPGLR